MSSEKEKSRYAKELYETKERAMEYYSENGVPEKMEDILNKMFYDAPNDVYGHLANYFESFAKVPTITKLQGQITYDSKAQPTLQTEIYCMVKNFEKLIHTSTSTNESYPSEIARPEDFEQAAEERTKFTNTALTYTQENVQTALKNKDPTKQEEIDIILLNTLQQLKADEEARKAKEKEEQGEEETSSAVSGNPAPTSPTKRKSAKGKGAKGPAVVVIPDEPREILLPGCGFVSAVSQAVCEAGAILADVPLYEHIASIRHGQAPDEYRLPLPMITILHSGRMWPGKQNCVKEFMLVPKPSMTMKDCAKHVTDIFNYCAKSLSAKTGLISKNVSDIGALCPTYDRAEQGLDLLQEAITQQGLTPAEDFHIALNLCGQEIFDYDKGKYDVIAGVQKLAEDLPDFYADLLTRYPAIIALIDPMRKQDKESWMKLCERVSEKCYVVGDSVYHRPGLLKDEEICDDFRTSAIVMRMENMTSVTDVIAASKKMQDVDNQIIIGTQSGESTNAFLVDLAVGLGSRFIKLGAPCRGERVVKLNRLLQLESHLQTAGKLGQYGEHTFPLIEPPPPPPEEGAEGSEGMKTPDSKK